MDIDAANRTGGRPSGARRLRSLWSFAGDADFCLEDMEVRFPGNPQRVDIRNQTTIARSPGDRAIGVLDRMECQIVCDIRPASMRVLAKATAAS